MGCEQENWWGCCTRSRLELRWDHEAWEQRADGRDSSRWEWALWLGVGTRQGISSCYVLLLTRVRNPGGGAVRDEGVVVREWSDFINSKMPSIIRCTIFKKYHWGREPYCMPQIYRYALISEMLKWRKNVQAQMDGTAGASWKWSARGSLWCHWNKVPRTWAETWMWEPSAHGSQSQENMGCGSGRVAKRLQSSFLFRLAQSCGEVVRCRCRQWACPAQEMDPPVPALFPWLQPGVPELVQQRQCCGPEVLHTCLSDPVVAAVAGLVQRLCDSLRTSPPFYSFSLVIQAEDNDSQSCGCGARSMRA